MLLFYKIIQCLKFLPYDEIDKLHGHPDLHRNKLEKKITTPDDSDIGYFIEVDLIYPKNIKKQRIFHFVLKINF